MKAARPVVSFVGWAWFAVCPACLSVYRSCLSVLSCCCCFILSLLGYERPTYSFFIGKSQKAAQDIPKQEEAKRK